MSYEVYEALRTLKNHCKKQKRCNQCEFYDSNYEYSDNYCICKLMNIAPEDYLKEGN